MDKLCWNEHEFSYQNIPKSPFLLLCNDGQNTLTTPGWRITEHTIRTKTAEITKLGEQIDLEKATVILQLYDNSVYLAGGTKGTKTSRHVAWTVPTTLRVSWWSLTRQELRTCQASWFC
jgi:hypothetical protein